MPESAALPHPREAADSRTPVHDDLLHAIHHAAHLLPSQGPITVFVHHNTLHPLEDRPFAEAVAKGYDFYGSEGYLDEQQYRREMARGRIRLEDLEAALDADLGDRADELIGFLGTRFHFQLAMLQHALPTGPSAELQWVVAETEALEHFRSDVPPKIRRKLVDSARRWVLRTCRDGASPTETAGLAAARGAAAELIGSLQLSAVEKWDDAAWEACTLQLLWKICTAGVQDGRRDSGRTAARQRHRDLLLAASGADSDALVHDVLIRYLSTALDQGLAHWALPGRDEGLYVAFLRLYGQRSLLTPRWMRPLQAELAELDGRSVGPLESIEQSLTLLGVTQDERESYITKTLLALPGWAGMVWQLETNAEWAVRTLPPGSLVQFLAIRLLLDRAAVTFLASDRLSYRGSLCDLRPLLIRRAPRKPDDRSVQRAFKAFQLAQLLGWEPETLYCLPAETWRMLSDELDDFRTIDRRRVFHAAYELSYRNQALDAIAAHQQRRIDAAEGDRASTKPAFQLITCIDDREESFRRHLEEIDPQCETFGYAGFFGVAMYYRGLAEAHSRPLCPVVIKPQHYVEESPAFTFQSLAARRAKTRKVIGSASRHFHRGTRSFIGGAVTALMGSLASFPLVMRILFPRATAQVRKLVGSYVSPPQVTQLVLERTEPTPGPAPGHVGYSVDEMANIVERTLRDNGLTRNFAPLIIMCGHGSSSLNNPHESAYNCGACSGGRGGPNARAFAQMANDPRVRRLLNERGLDVPPETYFLGAFHNTCDDAVEFFDLDRLPTVIQPLFVRVLRSIDEARQRNAHERCRRFESVGLDVTPEAALRHVEERSEDLSQARPEYNHATNSLCIVGRRQLTRGLYMDRRAFLASYDPTQDVETSEILARILQAVIPVCAGISLEYYFSTVDPAGYGCGSKLPHNITSLLGVMEGAASDLRPGLSAQMVEIHEPMRILFVIETTPEAMERIINNSAVIGQLCRNEWVQLATISSDGRQFHLMTSCGFVPHRPAAAELPEVLASVDWYRGWRDHLGFAQIRQTPSSGWTATASLDREENASR